MKKYQIVGLPRRFQDGGGTSYSVKSGDTFDDIAYDNGFNPSELRAANPGISYGNLSIGQVINFPKKKAVKKTITKPATQVAKKVGTGLFSKMMKAAKAVGEKEIYNDYFNQLRSQENAAKVGWDPKTKLWKPYPAPEKGGGYDIGPGLKLSGLSKKRDWYKGITTEEMNTMMKKIFEEKKKYASNYINKTYGKGTFENLSVPQQIILTDYQYNVAGGIEEFPNFAKGVVNNDVDLMLKEHVRTSDGKPLGRRNQFTVDWINRYFAKKQEEALPKKYKGGALPQAQSGVQVPRDKRKAFNKFLDDWAESGSYYEWNPDGTPVTMEQRLEEFYKSLQAANQQPTSAKIVQTKSPDKETWADRRRFKKFIKATMDDVYKDYVFRDIPEGKYNLATSGYKKILNPNYIFDDPDTPNVNEEQEAILSGKQAPDMRYFMDLPTSDIAGGKNKKGLFKKWKARREQAEMMNHVIAGLRGYGDLPMGYNDEDWKKYIDKYQSLIKEYKDKEYEDLQYKQYLQARKDLKNKKGRYSDKSMATRYFADDYKENNWARFDPATTKEEFPGYWKLLSDLGTEEKRQTLQTQLRVIPEIGGASIIRAFEEPGKTAKEFGKGVKDLTEVAFTGKTLDDIELGQGFYDGLFVGTLPIGTGLYSNTFKAGRYIHGLGKGTSSMKFLNKSNLPFTFRYKNYKGNIDIGLGASEYNLTNYKPLVQGTTGSGQWAIATKPLQQQMKSTSTVVNAPGPLLSNTKSLSVPNITSPVIPSAKIIEPTPSVPAQKTEASPMHHATNNPDGSIVFNTDYHTGVVAPKDAGQFMKTWEKDGYIYDDFTKTFKPKAKRSFKTLEENGKIADLKNSEGNVSTEKALRIMEKDESASSLKVSRIKKELENRYDGTIPAEISFDELNDVANSTIIPLNIEVQHTTGNPLYGGYKTGMSDFVANNEYDPGMMNYDIEDLNQINSEIEDLEYQIGQSESRIKDLNSEIDEIQYEVQNYERKIVETNPGVNVNNIDEILERDPVWLSLRDKYNDPGKKLYAEEYKYDILKSKLDDKKKLFTINEKKIQRSIGRPRNNDWTGWDINLEKSGKNYTKNPRQLVFNNKDKLPFGVDAHGADDKTLGRVYTFERANVPKTLFSNQIQSEFSQQPRGRKQTSAARLRDELAVNEFVEIMKQANNDISAMYKGPQGPLSDAGLADREELLNKDGWTREKDSTGRNYWVKGTKGEEGYGFMWDYSEQYNDVLDDIYFGLRNERAAAKTKYEELQKDIDYIRDSFKDQLPDGMKTKYQDVDLQTVINRVEDALGRSLFTIDPTSESFNANQIAATRKKMEVAPDARLFQRYNFERMVEETIAYAASTGKYEKVRFPTGSTANRIQDYSSYNNTRKDYTLENISKVPKSGYDVVNFGALIHNNIDINKAGAVISNKNLTEDDKINLVGLFNEWPGGLTNKLTVDEIVDIATSDEPLWQYVTEEVSTGEGTKKIKTFKSKYFTEEEVDKIKTLNSEGKRITNYLKKYKDTPEKIGKDDYWKLLDPVRYKIVERYEALQKFLKKRYPNAKVGEVTDEYGNTWWEITLPDDVLKGTKRIVPYKQGGSVEADLSPEDVKKYIEGGYILEELD